MMHDRKEEMNWVITVSLAILAVVALAAALIYTRAIMIPFVVALFIVALVSPIQDFQVKRLRLPRAIAMVITLLIVLALITLVSLGLAQVGRTIAYTATRYAEGFSGMADQMVEKIDSLIAYLKPQELPAQPLGAPNEPKPTPPPTPAEAKPVEKEPEVFVLSLSIKDSAAAGTLEKHPWLEPPKEPSDPNDPNETRAAILDVSPDAPWQLFAKQMIRDLRNYIFNILMNAVGTIFGMISSIFFVVIFVLFMLLGRNPHAEHSQVYTDIVQKIRRYVGIKIAVSALTGLLVWATLNAIGLQLAGMFGILAFLLNFIPSIGSMIATLLPIPIAVVQFQDSPKFAILVILAVAVPGAIQNILGNLVEPKLQGEGLNLHPVTILLALSFWGLLWGIVGMLLAAPITAAIRIVLMQFDTFKPLTDLMAGDFSKPPMAATVERGPADTHLTHG
jgi:AI-2 transport protein TqsA